MKTGNESDTVAELSTRDSRQQALLVAAQMRAVRTIEFIEALRRTRVDGLPGNIEAARLQAQRTLDAITDLVEGIGA